MTTTINGTTGVTFPDASVQNTAATGFGFKNRIINGSMMIDQRNAGAATANTINGYTLDRWNVTQSTSGKLIAQQNAGAVTPPAGFKNYLGITSQSAYTVGSGDYYLIFQKIEGYNFVDFAWGTANASAATLSFKVYSSLTGTFGGSVENSAQSRAYPFTYTISSANTWTTVSITIPGDTTGTWLTDNGTGLQLNIGLGVGSTYSGTAGAWAASTYLSATGATSVVGTNGATFYITGVQLEKGSTATSFDYRPYGTEQNLCYRYYYKMQATSANAFFGSGFNESTTVQDTVSMFPVTMRTAPTALEQNGTAGDYRVNNLTANTACSSVPVFASADVFSARTQFTVASGLTAGQGSIGRSTNSNAYLGWSAEL